MKAALERYREKHIHYCANCRNPLKNYKGRNHKYCKVCSINIRLKQADYVKIHNNIGIQLGIDIYDQQ